MRYVRDLTEGERDELETMAQQEVSRVALRAQHNLEEVFR